MGSPLRATSFSLRLLSTSSHASRLISLVLPATQAPRFVSASHFLPVLRHVDRGARDERARRLQALSTLLKDPNLPLPAFSGWLRPCVPFLSLCIPVISLNVVRPRCLAAFFYLILLFSNPFSSLLHHSPNFCFTAFVTFSVQIDLLPSPAPAVSTCGHDQRTETAHQLSAHLGYLPPPGKT
ncbi:hypothetical protein DL89DRAFT_17166 [Linderina pennispora]|uniref:Uncharacterized protein n=1 Tax=Linderina pennispora TaxID=61395 RepID=A0A1Y1WLP1_9FUNG|nr:uncharacterized protein DL89DRAFT_17166 [Linderina pennispora]ORX74489.1 hypothetical protein DL89DRAFT_17166 [Linderina pennispora]